MPACAGMTAESVSIFPGWYDMRYAGSPGGLRAGSATPTRSPALSTGHFDFQDAGRCAAQLSPGERQAAGGRGGVPLRQVADRAVRGRRVSPGECDGPPELRDECIVQHRPSLVMPVRLVPAQAGSKHSWDRFGVRSVVWIPACAEMTGEAPGFGRLVLCR